MKLTLLQQKSRPIHRLRHEHGMVVARSYCGVDVYRQGVRTENVNVGQSVTTCKACLAAERREKLAKED